MLPPYSDTTFSEKRIIANPNCTTAIMAMALFLRRRKIGQVYLYRRNFIGCEK